MASDKDDERLATLGGLGLARHPFARRFLRLP